MKEQKIPRERLMALWKLERSLKFRFDDRHILNQALTHPSFAHEQSGKKIGHYEQLEFIGDAVLDLIVGDMLFRENPKEGEGFLTRARADLVNQNALAEIATGINLGDSMRLGKGERRTHGWMKPSILAASFEAVVGAMYMDSGYDKTFKVIGRLFKPLLNNGAGMRDPRSRLQEWTQKNHRLIPEYRIVGVVGPSHDRQFLVAVSLNNRRLATAEGPSKKEAFRRAAIEALAVVENDE